MLEFFEKWDRSLFLLINDWHSPFFDQIMWHLSGKFEWIPLYLLLLFFIYRKFGVESWKIIVGIAAVIALTDQLSVHLFKEVFERYRPCHNLEIKSLVHSVNNKCGGKFGFVSSHATNTFGLATFIGLLLVDKGKKWMFYSLLIWASVVSYSRIYLGVHYPADVFCGAILGFVIGYTVYRVLLKLAKLKERKNGN